MNTGLAFVIFMVLFICEFNRRRRKEGSSGLTK